MSQSTTHFTLSRSKIASALGKFAKKSRKQNSKAFAPKTKVEQEFYSATSEVDVLSMLGYPTTSTLRVFNAQRSTKVPSREPAGFPTNQNFSQRMIYEFSHDEEIEAIFLTPYMRPSEVLPAMPSSPKETRVVPLQGSSSTPRGDTPSFCLGRPIRGFSTCCDPNKQVKVEETKYPFEEMLILSHSSIPRVECSHMESPPRGEAIRAKALYPHTPYNSTSNTSNLITPGLSSSSSTPSAIGNVLTPIDSAGKASQDEMHFTSPKAHSFIPFPTISTPILPFSKVIDPLLPHLVGSVSQSSSYEGRSSEGYRPLGSEMMDTLDFLAHLCKRPELLAGDSESLLNGESDDDDGLMEPFYHAI